MKPESSPILALNINNTNTRLVLLSQSAEPRLLLRLRTPELTTGTLRPWSLRFPALPLIAASVVPLRNPAARAAFSKHPQHWVSHRSPLGIPIGFPRPRTVGADRLANAVAASTHALPAVVLDFGTALTFDIVTRRGGYLGGIIAPGLRAFSDYLHERTALLPRIPLRPPDHVIGTSTVSAMQSGAFHGYTGLILHLLQKIRRELRSPRLRILATGGDAPLLAPSLPGLSLVDPWLTFRGLHLIAQHWLARDFHP